MLTDPYFRADLVVIGTTNANRWSFLQFDVTAGKWLPSGTTGAHVSKAMLYLYANRVDFSGDMDVYKVTSFWKEGTKNGTAESGTVTYANLPSYGSSLGTINIDTTEEAEYVEVDVTNLVKDWIDNGNNYGLLFKPNGTAIQAYFDAKENGSASHAPFLDVTLSPQNSSLAAISAGTWTGANSITTLGTVTTGTWNGSTIAVANGGTGSTTAGGARSNLGLTIGSNVQAWDADLDDLADGSLSGSKVGSGINAANITTGTLALANGGTGSTGGNITGSGALAFTAGGSNNNITLAPSGTGKVITTTDVSINGLTLGLGGGGSAYNLALGHDALYSNTDGSGNTAIGRISLNANTTGYNNVAVGDATLAFNTTGQNNAAAGGGAMQDNTTGSGNAAFGSVALNSNTTGDNNTAFGAGALDYNTTGYYNVGLGAGGWDIVCGWKHAFNNGIPKHLHRLFRQRIRQ